MEIGSAVSVNYSFLSRNGKESFVRKEAIFRNFSVDIESIMVWSRTQQRQNGGEGAGGVRKKRKGRVREIWNMSADICQEIDNSNKLVAKRSNSLPNGTILPLLPAANQTIRARTRTHVRADVLRRDPVWNLRVSLIYTTRTADCKRILWPFVFFANSVGATFAEMCGITLIARRLPRNFGITVFFIRAPISPVTRSPPVYTIFPFPVGNIHDYLCSSFLPTLRRWKKCPRIYSQRDDDNFLPGIAEL